MNYLVWLFPLFLFVIFMFSSSIRNKSEGSLPPEYAGSLAEINEKGTKKSSYIFLFIFFVFMISSIIENDDYHTLIIFVLIGTVLIILFYISFTKYLKFKNNNFPIEFLRDYKKSEGINIIGVVSIIIFLFIKYLN